MNREEFAKRLYSTIIPEGTAPENIQVLIHPVSETIREMMPNKLFRFRAFDERSVDAFENDIIYAVTADKFNDPYDTLVRYDLEGVEKWVNTVMNTETLGQMKAWYAQGWDLPKEVKHILPKEMTDTLKVALLSIEGIRDFEERIEETRKRMISLIETYFPILSETSKRYSTMACFSESIESVLMWSHYADSHKGFALEYDFRPILDQPIKNVGLFPVVYSEERFDISDYIAWEFLRTIGIPAKMPDISASIKNALWKSDIWAYEKEWRMIDLTPRDITDEKASAIHYKPVAIYYGRHMSGDDKKRLHELAKQKEINEYEMYLDYSSKKYEMLYREYKGGRKSSRDDRGAPRKERIMKLLNDKLFNAIEVEAKSSSRHRMNYDLRTQAMDEDPDWRDGSQRMLNVMMADTVIPIHRHTETSETVIVLRGSGDEDGTTIFEAKDRPYDPVKTEEFLA